MRIVIASAIGISLLIAAYIAGRESDGYPAPAVRAGTASTEPYATSNSRPAPIEQTERLPVSPAQAQEIIRERIAELDSNLMADRVDTAWAVPMQAKISKAIADSGYADDKDGIGTHAVTCRTNGCRIDLEFKHDELSEDAMMMIRKDVGADLPQTLTASEPGPNGSRVYHIYAATPQGGALLRKAVAPQRNTGDLPRRL